MFRKRCCYVCWSVLAIASLCLAQFSQPMEQAEEAYFSQDWKSAVVRYGQMLVKEPTNGLAMYHLGMGLVSLDRFEEGTHMLEQATRNGIVGASPYYNLAVASLKAGHKEAAEAWLRKSLQTGFSNAGALESDADLEELRKNKDFGELVSQARRNAEPQIGEAVFSPDGTSILFYVLGDGCRIYLLDVVTEKVRLVRKSKEFLMSASWWPNGKRILFASGARPGTKGARDIFVMDRNGGNAVQLTHGTDQKGYPKVSPDGKRILFNGDQSGHRQIYVMDADGSNVRQLTDGPAHSDYPSWSPDGEKIIFESDRDHTYESYIMNADGSEVTHLGQRFSHVHAPVISPDGKKVVAHAFRDGNFEIYLMDIDGNHLRRLTQSPGIDNVPSWSPDGKTIVFHSFRDGCSGLYVMEMDGRNVRRIAVKTKELRCGN